MLAEFFSKRSSKKFFFFFYFVHVQLSSVHMLNTFAHFPKALSKGHVKFT